MDSDELRAYFATRSGGLSTYQKRELKKLLEIAIARAEVAEARADALEDANAVLSDALESTRRKLEKMTTAFTALQAAGEWRPVDDKPAHGQDVEVCAILTGVWWDDDGIFDVYQVPDEITIKGWRPAPPQE